MTQVWGLWNEGNLFSLSTAQLTQFLTSERVEIDPRWKKAALVRQVEELLQSKGSQTTSQPASGGERYGEWDKPVKAETMLDLSQTGFYEGGGAMTPRAFQILVTDSAPDLVVSRVNTTAFPGFPANNECYTLTSADAEQSTRSRYSKALQWCIMNLRNLGVEGEISVEFGKLLISPEVIRKNKRIVSAWTLQQRLQTANPHTWVSAVSEAARAEVVKLLEANEYREFPEKGGVTYDVVVRRAKDQVAIDLNASGATVAVNKPHEDLQTTHVVRELGPDVRLRLRSRQPLKKSDIDTYTKASIVKVKADPVEVTLPPELGEVSYTSENEERHWKKRLDLGVTVTVIERRRTPLVVCRNEDEGERFEYEIIVPVPSVAERVDLNALANEVFDLSRAISDASSDSFMESFGTQSQAVNLEQE